MSINTPLTDPTLDPVTGIPLGALYATQYQVPLGSQPINLEELNAQGKQGNWLYPDNLPSVVARLQARDLTNPGNAQDLSTDGLRNLNVNINALNPAVPIGGGSGVKPVAMQSILTTVTASTSGPTYWIADLPTLPNILYGYSASIAWQEPFGATYFEGSFYLSLHNQTSQGDYVFCVGNVSDWSTSTAGYTTATAGKSIPFNQCVMFPVPVDLTALISPDPNNMRLNIALTNNLICIQILLWMA